MTDSPSSLPESPEMTAENQDQLHEGKTEKGQPQEPGLPHPALYWLAEVIDSLVNLVCITTAHFRGCWVMQMFINTRLGTWVFGILSANRYPEYRGACDGCQMCGVKHKHQVPNPYYASERELAEWARWYGSDVSPKDYAEFWKGKPRTGDSADTHIWTYCANCGTGSINTISARTA